MDKLKVKARCDARKMLLQALYQWLMSGNALIDIHATSRAVPQFSKIDAEYFESVLYDLEKNIDHVEHLFEPYLDRPVDQLNPIEHSILRLSTYELYYRLDIPVKVVLNEAVHLAKVFGSQDGHRYVNGILHQVAQSVRALELNEGR